MMKDNHIKEKALKMLELKKGKEFEDFVSVISVLRSLGST